MRKIRPMLCRDEPEVFDSPEWIWETKYDGARIIAFVTAGGAQTRLFGRSGSEKTKLFPELRFLAKKDCILDGEVISGAEAGCFNSIQHRINRGDAGLSVGRYPAILKVFDILEVDMGGRPVSLAPMPLIERKGALSEIVLETDTVRLSEYTEDGIELYAKVEARDGEGVIGKRKNGVYAENRREWLKVKTWRYNFGPNSTGETFLAVGYTKGTGWRQATFGALVLARLEPDGTCVHAGEVGTGFEASDIRSLCAMFSPSACPFPRQPEPATWIKPFAVKVRYLEYTKDNKLRFPSFKGVV